MARKRQAKKNGGGVAVPADKPPIVRGNVNRIVTVDPSFASLYANDVQVQTSPWDVRLTFGDMSVEEVEGGPKTAHIKRTGEVRMSPSLAKRLVVIMFQQLKTYEERFGQIPQPPDSD